MSNDSGTDYTALIVILAVMAILAAGFVTWLGL